MNRERVACAVIPNFSIEVCLKDDPALRRTPLALTENGYDIDPIIALNDAAIRTGLNLDMTAAQAGTLCPGLEVRTLDLVREIEQSNGIFKQLQRLSPFVEEAVPGTFFLDAAGLILLYKSEPAFVDHILAAVQPCGYPVRVGLADNRFVAELAAVTSDDNPSTIVASGDERAFLKDFSLSYLPVSFETEDTLRDLGLNTIDDVAAFPLNELTRRFGPEGAQLSKLAKGTGNTDYFSRDNQDDDLSNSLYLTDPISDLRALSAHVEQLLSPLLESLGRFSLGCSTITITLDLDNKTQRTLSVSVEHPTLSAKTFIRQMQTLLGDVRSRRLSRAKSKGPRLPEPSPDVRGRRPRLPEPLPAAVLGITVTIPQIARLLTEQLNLSATSATTARDALKELPDNGLIRLPRLRSAILPEQRFSLEPPEHAGKRKADRNVEPRIPPFALRNIAGLRLVQPPREINVTIKDRRIAGLTIDRRRESISRYQGPWELSGGWWAEAFNRLYYEAGTDRRYLIFYDRLSSRWFLQGIFD
jgi:nucleotidyltransferase/DNA polymerase involved in DNA repair